MSSTSINITRKNHHTAERMLGVCLTTVEQETKSKGIGKDEDVNKVAKNCFERLKKKMESNETWMMIALKSVEVFFAPEFSIAEDLEKYQKDPLYPIELVWPDLCDIEKAIAGEKRT